MKYNKPSSVQGNWLRGQNVEDGAQCTLTTEAQPVPSQFKDKNGNSKNQDVAKIKFKGSQEELNINLNRATVAGLIDAFGDDSKDWVGKVLIAHTEKVVVSGKRVTAVYLIPEGYEVAEDDNGYIVIVKEGQTPATGPDELPTIPF